MTWNVPVDCYLQHFIHILHYYGDDLLLLTTCNNYVVTYGFAYTNMHKQYIIVCKIHCHHHHWLAVIGA